MKFGDGNLLGRGDPLCRGPDPILYCSQEGQQKRCSTDAENAPTPIRHPGPMLGRCPSRSAQDPGAAGCQGHPSPRTSSRRLHRSFSPLAVSPKEDQWFPEKPFKGSGYRCIRINHKMDPIISKAASQIGLSLPQLYQLLPSELTLWVDPYEVSYRIGEDGSICVLYEATATKPVSSYGMLTCKNQMMLGRTSPSKNYIMTVSS
ncbi:PREDICTED: protein BTG2 [Pygoscelis adeliae]|uniref:protein BTG2 n=1 Tax=Pygoscelis adeliae TaxID=9238 RepID=UPI0004F4DE8F|nr:PREDICTED: protein BTG2 [Pygoscelis adeliae]